MLALASSNSPPHRQKLFEGEAESQARTFQRHSLAVPKTASDATFELATAGTQTGEAWSCAEAISLHPAARVYRQTLSVGRSETVPVLAPVPVPGPAYGS